MKKNKKGEVIVKNFPGEFNNRLKYGSSNDMPAGKAGERILSF